LHIQKSSAACNRQFNCYVFSKWTFHAFNFYHQRQFRYASEGSSGARVGEVQAHQMRSFASNMLEFLFLSNLTFTTTGSSGAQVREVQTYQTRLFTSKNYFLTDFSLSNTTVHLHVQRSSCARNKKFKCSVFYRAEIPRIKTISRSIGCPSKPSICLLCTAMSLIVLIYGVMPHQNQHNHTKIQITPVPMLYPMFTISKIIS
jgi:hypothetical protein